MRDRVLKKEGDEILNGRYKVLELLHSSGMSAVYKVIDSQLGTIWCLKEIDKENSGRNKIEYRSLLREARIMRGLSHPSIPRIVTIDIEDNKIFIVMDYVHGKSLKELLDQRKVLSQSQAVSIMTQVAKVMLYLHSLSNPIFYRDLKPSNVMLMKDGTIRVLDFGISEEISEDNKVIEEALGTKGFAAPEQSLRGTKYDLRGDIFAFGRTFYNLLTGISIMGVSSKELKPLRRVNASVTVGLEAFINKCMADKPADRFQTFQDVLVALQDVDKGGKGRKFGLLLRVGLFGVAFVGALGLGVRGYLAGVNAEKESKSRYESAFVRAESSLNPDDWVKVIEMKPNDLSNYNKMLDSMLIDGVFSSEDEELLLKTVSPNLQVIQDLEEFKELSGKIGKAFWYYSPAESRDGGIIKSGKWLFENREDTEIDMLYTVSEFNKNLKSAVVEGKDRGIYKDFFLKLSKGVKEDRGVSYNLGLRLALVKCISLYSNKLYSDGVEVAEMSEELSLVDGYISSIETTTDFERSYVSEIKSFLKSAESSVGALNGR